MPSGSLCEGDVVLASGSPPSDGDRASTPRSPTLSGGTVGVLGSGCLLSVPLSGGSLSSGETSWMRQSLRTGKGMDLGQGPQEGLLCGWEQGILG